MQLQPTHVWVSSGTRYQVHVPLDVKLFPREPIEPLLTAGNSPITQIYQTNRVHSTYVGCTANFPLDVFFFFLTWLIL